MPDNNGLSPLMISATWFNKPAETQRSDRRQTPLNTEHAPHFSNRQGTQKSGGKKVFADCELHYSASSSAMICKPEETQESEAERKLVADELHPSMSSQPQETDTGGNRQRRMSDTSHCASSGPPPFSKTGGSAVADQIRHFASSFFRWADALAVFLLLFSVGGCSAAGNLCDEKREILVVQKGEVALVCPVTAEVHQTKHSVVITVANNHTHEEVLACDWLSYSKLDCLKSRYGAELIEIQADCVLARLPEDRVQQNGSYRTQLVPHDPDQPFTDCILCYPVVPKDMSTTKAPTTANHHFITSESPKDTAGDEDLTTTTFLFCTVLFLLVILVVMVAFQLRKKGIYRITLGSCYVKKRSGTPVHQSCQTGSLFEQVAQEDNKMNSSSDFASGLA